MADQFPGIDFGQWQTWESYRTPDGREYKVIPGPTGGNFVVDVVESYRMGRPVARPNPRQVYEAADKQKKQQEEDNSLTAQLAAPAGMIAGLYGAKKLAGMELPSVGDMFGGSSSAGQSVASEAGKEAVSSLPDFLSGAGSSGAEAIPVQTLSDGTTLMSDGSTLAADGGGVLGTAGTILGAAAAAKGGYDTIKGMQNGGEGTRAGLTTMGSGIGSILLPGVGTVAGAAIGNVAGYGLQGDGIKNDLALAALGPMGWGLLGAKKLGLTNRKTTRQFAQENTNELLKSAGDDQNAINYVTGMREQYNSAPADPLKPFAGKYGSFEEYQKAGLEARDLSGVYGNISTYGAKEWAGLTQDQREAITAENIKRNNYASKKGDVIIQDKQAAQEAWNSVLKPATQAKGAAPLQTQLGITQGQPITKGPLLIMPGKVDERKKELLSKAMSR